MAIWALADLHLSFGVPDKKMDVFGEKWVDHPQQIEEHWRAVIGEDDLVLLPGDISWAMRLPDVIPDLEWIDKLPGTKVILRGNHDYWWGSLSKMQKLAPSSIHFIHNTVFNWENVSVGGSRLWDNPAFGFGEVIKIIPNPISAVPGAPPGKDAEEWAAKQERIFQRELGRLEHSLKQMDPDAEHRIAMTHYPPVSLEMEESEASAILKRYDVDICVFGHLHNVTEGMELFGERDGIRYIFTAADHVHFRPVRVL